MWAKTSISGRLGRIVFLGVWLLITIFPLYWIINTSFKTPGSIFSQPLHYYPDQFTFDNFIGILQDGAYGNFTVYFLNSVLIATVAAALTTVIALFSGYTLARFQFRTHGAVLLGFLVTQMLPGFIALGPLFQMMTNLGMTDSKYGLTLLYFAGAIPFSTIMLRAFFENTPPSLEEAALVDGCSRVGALFRIVVPIMIPGIAATFVFNWVNIWNELFLAVIMINSDENKTLPVALNGFISSYNIEWGPMSAAAVLALLPPIALFAFANRFIISGLTAGAVRG